MAAVLVSSPFIGARTYFTRCPHLAADKKLGFYRKCPHERKLVRAKMLGGTSDRIPIPYQKLSPRHAVRNRRRRGSLFRLSIVPCPKALKYSTIFTESPTSSFFSINIDCIIGFKKLNLGHIMLNRIRKLCEIMFGFQKES